MDDADVEVVLLTATSRDALLRTHARYFRNLPELAAALGEALPVINGTGSSILAKGKRRIAQQKP